MSPVSLSFSFSLSLSSDPLHLCLMSPSHWDRWTYTRTHTWAQTHTRKHMHGVPLCPEGSKREICRRLTFQTCKGGWCLTWQTVCVLARSQSITRERAMGKNPKQQAWINPVKAVFEKSDYRYQSRGILPIGEANRCEFMWVCLTLVTSNYAD